MVELNQDKERIVLHNLKPISYAPRNRFYFCNSFFEAAYYIPRNAKPQREAAGFKYLQGGHRYVLFQLWRRQLLLDHHSHSLVLLLRR